MKKIITLFALMLSLCATAQEAVGEYMYIHRNNNTVERILLSEIDSVTFVEILPAPQYEAVDLGLPSGLKWAACNVGASKPEEFGGYYAWGETEEKDDYSWSTYKYCNGNGYSMTKYCTSSSSGTVDNKTVLELEDDVASMEWGADWRMPTSTDMQELIDNCTWQWTSVNGVNGYKVIGSNGNSIFLPAAGLCDGTETYQIGSSGNYWLSSLGSGSSNGACGFGFDDSYYDMGNGSRFGGLSVRPVCGSVTKPADTPYEAIDLGLSVKWASCNVGATKPEEYGGYYAWGETEEKSNYNWSTYKWCNGSYYTMTKYCTSSGYGTVDNKTVLDLEDDVAHVKWGGNWRMPTSAEQAELRNSCTWQWTSVNGVNGYKVTGPNGNSIFLPAAGYRDGTGVKDRGSKGDYWLSLLYDYSCYGAYNLHFGGGGSDLISHRYYGQSVRPVSK